MTLSQLERQILANQHEILSYVSEEPEEKQYHKSMVEVYQHGFESEYLLHGVSEDTLSPEDCQNVSKILKMYDDLYYYWKKSGELQDSIEDRLVKFPGFDLQNDLESKCYLCVEHILGRDEHSFQEIQDLKKDGHDFNSHSYGPGYQGYLEMLNRYEEMQEQRMKRDLSSGFTVEEMEYITTR